MNKGKEHRQKTKEKNTGKKQRKRTTAKNEEIGMSETQQHERVVHEIGWK